MDRGSRVGELARSYVPGGVLIDLRTTPTRNDRRTNEALQNRAPALYEASFLADGVFTAVDILKREEARLSPHRSEIEHIGQRPSYPDVAVQAHVLRPKRPSCHRRRRDASQRECAYPDLSNLFTRSD